VIVLRAPSRLSEWLDGERPLRVLVGADLGRTSEAARRFASQVAALGSAEVEVTLVAAPEEAHKRLGLGSPDGAELAPDAEAALTRELARAAPVTETAASLRVIAGHGRADAHLVAHADRGGFDLIVVGTRRHSVIEEVWHGSVGRGVLQSSPVSVAHVPLPPAEADASFRSPRVVLVATDFTDDRRALTHAIGYAEGNATVHLAHVVTPSGTATDPRQAQEDAWSQLYRLERDVPAARSVALHTHVLEGAPGEQLLALSERVGADLLVLGARKRTAVGRAVLGSVAQTLVASSTVPVLMVPPRKH
jgi:nucleotide-binding universal stress UspA family protein